MSHIFAAGYDVICHRLQCAGCGRTSDDPCAIDMQVKVALDRNLRALRVGDVVRIDDDLEYHSGYLKLHERPLNIHERVVILEEWTCPYCLPGKNWAALRLERDVLRDVTTIVISADSLASADFITGGVFYWFPKDENIELDRLPKTELRDAIVRIVNMPNEEE